MELLKECGTVVNIRWPTDRATGRFKGFGFVTMGSVEECQNAVELPVKDLGGRLVAISMSGSNSNQGGRGCFSCGKEDHLSRDCPNAPKRQQGGRSCFNCGKEDHISRDCPTGGQSNQGGRSCFKCGQEDHISRDCPSMNQNGGSGRDCFKCGKPGHQSRECPEAGSGGGYQGGAAKTCFKCGQEGHFSKDCGQPQQQGSTLFITKVGDAVTDEMVKELVKDCGTVQGIRWATDRETGKFKGFGFISMSSAAECQKVVDLPQKVLAGREVIISISNK